MTREWFDSLREVKSVPKGYQVWNIGKKNGAEYDPNYLIVGLFDKNGHGVDFVKIQTEKSGDIYDGACFGYTLKELEKVLTGRKRVRRRERPWLEHKRPKMEKALEGMRAIQWD